MNTLKNKAKSFNAKKIWNQFYQKFDPQITLEKTKYPYDLNEKDTNICSNKKYPRAFIDYINGAEVHINLNEQKQQNLLIALGKTSNNNGTIQCDYNHKIYEDAQIVAIAAGLFAEAKITRFEMQTINLFHDACYKSAKNGKCSEQHKIKDRIKAIPIFDEENHFTIEANRLLNLNLQGYNFSKLSYKKIDQFRQLLLELNQSQHYIFKCTMTDVNKKNYKIIKRFIEQNWLSYEICEKETHLYFFTAGAENALGLVIFGINDWFPMFTSLLEKTPADMDEGMRNSFRYSIACYANTVPYGPKLHTAKFFSPLDYYLHDLIHSHVCSRIGEELNRVFDYIQLIIRTHIFSEMQFQDYAKGKPLTKNSKAYWFLTDRVFEAYLSPDLINKIHHFPLVNRFCFIMKEISEDSYMKMNLLFDNNGHKITDIGILVFIDMVRNSQIWASFNFYPNMMPSPFLEEYQFAVRNLQCFTNNPIGNIIKWRKLRYSSKFNHNSYHFFRNNKIGFLGLKPDITPTKARSNQGKLLEHKI